MAEPDEAGIAADLAVRSVLAGGSSDLSDDERRTIHESGPQSAIRVRDACLIEDRVETRDAWFQSLKDVKSNPAA